MKNGNVKYIFILLILLYSCLPEGAYKAAVNYEPSDTGDGWDISSTTGQGLNSEKLQDVYEMIFAEDKFITSRSLLIVRNGKLVSESYIRDRDDINRKNSIQGITKSITSLLTGMAWDQDLIQLDDKLYRYIPAYFDGDRNKREITFDHLLTMKIGLDWDNENHTSDLFNSKRYPSTMRIVLTKPFLTSGGTSFHYNHGAPQLAMGIMSKAYEMNSTDSVIHKLFDPLGIDDFVWEQHSDGINIGGLGLHLKPRDIARIGQFCLQNGLWGGRQVVSEEWIGKSTSTRVNPETTGSPFGYGYYWWTHDENSAYMGMGEGGQYLYIVPGENLVIVHTASSSVGAGYDGIKPEDFISLADLILSALE